MTQIDNVYIDNIRMIVNGLIEYYETLQDEGVLDTTYFIFFTNVLVERGANRDLLNNLNYIDGLLVAYSQVLVDLEDLNG
jgi:hypothetical protein